MPPHHSVASPPPLRTLRSLLAGTLVPATLWLRSPLERGHILFPDHANLHGWHVTPGIVYQFGRVHIAGVAEARSDLLLPSDSVSQHRTSDRILLPRSRFTGRAHLLLPCSLPHFRFGFGPIIRLQLRLEPLFLPCPPPAITLSTGHPLTTCRCEYRMADMSADALLTKRSKPILALSLVKPLRILLPRTRFLRHRI